MDDHLEALGCFSFTAYYVESLVVTDNYVFVAMQRKWYVWNNQMEGCQSCLQDYDKFGWNWDSHWGLQACDCPESSQHVQRGDVSCLLCDSNVMHHFLNRYGYAHFLHEKIFTPSGVQWLWQDIICQYWPWASSKALLFEYSKAMGMKPALSVMHAKAHSWHCQVCTFILI